MQSRSKVERIILSADGRDGAHYAIAVCTDGRLALMRNGEMSDGAAWEAKQMDACVEEFARRSGIDPKDVR